MVNMMKFRLILVLLLPLLALARHGEARAKRDGRRKLHITVLYESLCPDSKRFMRHLAPVYNDLHNYLDVTLVPFGKSSSSNNGAQFHCQHGPPECEGNRLQACVLHTTKQQSKQVKFAACQMQEWNYADITNCATEAGLSTDIDECVRTEEGTRLQLEAEQITKAYQPKFIPTIIYNGQFDQSLQDNSVEDFRGTVCTMLHEANILSKSSNKCSNVYV